MPCRAYTHTRWARQRHRRLLEDDMNGRYPRVLLPAARAAAVTASAVVLAAGCSSSSASASKASAPSASTGSATAVAATPSAAPAPTSLLGLQNEYVSIVKQVLPSVVQITTSSGLGSGVIWDDRGDIVTNDHVVGTATSFQVRLATNSKTYSASLVGTYPPDDLAVIRVRNAAGLRPASFGDSSTLETGDIVLAMGNPLGLASSVTDGIVSAVGRTVDEPQDTNSPGATIPDAIQTSAAINPGNSGGALVDLTGHVIGIPTLAAVDQEIGGGSAAPGIGFAIPSNIVKTIAGQLVASGKVANSGRAALNVTVTTVAGADGQPAGVAIESVQAGGAAAAAGLHQGDVITAVGSSPITSTSDLADALAQHAPGQRVTVTVTESGGSSRTLAVTLGQLR